MTSRRTRLQERGVRGLATSVLYYGDNLPVLRQHVPDESIDLVYLDPPFNSNQNYNVLFAEKDGSGAAAQIRAFGDTWHWDESSSRAFEQVVEGGSTVADAMVAFRQMLGSNDMLAYLSMMAPRLLEMRRVLKEAGSIYLHCDPTASHYLKMLMDAVFGTKNFRNEIVWKRTFARGAMRKWASIHDVILFYSKSDNYTWNRVYQPYDDSYVSDKYRFTDERGRYRLVVLTGPGTTEGDSGKAWRGYDPTSAGRHWAVPRRALAYLESIGVAIPQSIHGQLDLLLDHDLIRIPQKPDGTTGVPEFKLYLEEGYPIQGVITDIPPINSQASERLGYPTQKPVALLERIIRTSSNEGDVVLDPFCGCGTAVDAAQRLKRRWIGIDITYLAIGLIRRRLVARFGESVEFKVIGEPTTFQDAVALAEQDKYQFQWWALDLVHARPTEERRGADRGIDGRLNFFDDRSGKRRQVIFSVKGGSVGVHDIRELRGVVEREKAEIGVLITLNDPTKPMIREAADAGFWKSEWRERPYARLQILTVAALLDGKAVDMPPVRHVNDTFRDAPRAIREADQHPLFGDSVDDDNDEEDLAGVGRTD